MDKKVIGKFRKLFESNLEQTSSQVGAMSQAMTMSPDDSSDEIDYATARQQQHLCVRLHERQTKLLGKIREALARIADGSFGLCQNCGDEIGMRRLEARPIATLCVECQGKAEGEELKRRSDRTAARRRMSLALCPA